MKLVADPVMPGVIIAHPEFHMALVAGTRLGPYEILSALGAGGMGQVYRARDTRLQRTVAIKILPPEFASDSQFEERFEREARSIAALNHPHICTLHDVGREDGTRFLVMELVDGETLADRIARGLIPTDETLSIAKQIADALEAAHKQGIIHQGRQYVQEEHYENHCTESLAYGGGSDFCGGLRPAQAGKPDDRYRHHQG